MRVYHRTNAVESILRAGFRDATGYYLTVNEHSGVWVSDAPLDENAGAGGRFVISLEVPDDQLEPYEWAEDGKPYREFLVPAELLNGRPLSVVED